MKKLIFIGVVLLGFNANAQQKLDRLYATSSLLFTGQQNWFVPQMGIDFGLTANYKSKFSTKGGYSNWGIIEKYQSYDVFFVTEPIYSNYHSVYAQFGFYKKLTPRISLQGLAGPSYYRINKAHNFVEIDNSIYATVYDFDRKTLDEVGVMLSAEGMIHFARVTGVIVGFDGHISKNVNKLNFRVGIPLGYFEKIRKSGDD